MRNLRIVVLILLVISLLSGCGPAEQGGNDGTTDNPGTTLDTTKPTVSSTSPANNATAVTVNSAIAATFSETMDSSTINGTTFTISGWSGSVSGTVTYNGSTATFTPSSNLSYNTTYTATITTGAKDVAGNAMANSYYWNFTTGSQADTTPPTISSLSPTNNATGVSINASVSVTFSETMDTSTINDTTFTLKDGTTPVPCTITYSETTATLAPWNTLSYSTTYSASITTGAKDAAGNAMISNSIWTFTTESLTDAMATTTADATNITDTSVTLNGSFNNLIGDTTTVWFEYGITTSYGNSSISTAHTTAGNKSVSMNIAGLASYTTYHFRIVAQNSGGTYYGTDNIFATLKTPTVLATGSSPYALAVDSTSVYWKENTTIKKVDISGGTITTLASGQSTYSYGAIAVDSTTVYWTDGFDNGAVRKVDKNGGTVTTLASGLSFPYAIAIDTTSVYWMEPYSGIIKKIGKAGGPVTTLISGMHNNYAIAVDAASVYWTEGAWQQADNNGAVRKMGINGGMVTTLASGFSAYSIAVDSNNVYWSEYNDGAIKKVGINGGTVTTLASGLNYPYAISVDSTNVYWTKYAGYGGNIMTVGINGGTSTMIASELTYPSAIAVDSTSVYWTELDSNGAVKKVEK